MHIDPSTTSSQDNYKLLTNLVVPRPIAWVTTQNSEGVINLAPTTVSKWINLRSFFTGNWADGDSRKRVLKVFNQDKPIVESQHPQIVPYDLNTELHVQSDALQIEYRKMRRQFFKD